jgi:hypothetical protein
MELSKEEIKIQQESIDYINSHQNELIVRFITSKKPLQSDLLTFFMAGSPGAGKTEFSRRYMPETIDKTNQKLVNRFRKMKIDITDVDVFFIKIDVDEIRNFIPKYQKTNIRLCIKGNAHIIQKATTKGLDVLRKYCLKNSISFLHDGTFGNYEMMKELVKKSLRLGRDVQIFYIYLDPLVAWEFTKAREFLEGRNIIREKFVEQFFASRENVDKIKQEFGGKIDLHCIIKDQKNEVEEIRFNIDNVDKFIKKYYNKKSISIPSKEGLLKLIQ